MGLLSGKRKIVLWTLGCFALIGAGLGASIAWFKNGTNNFEADVSGSVVEEYFHCGNGSQADPYVITRPIHYYHLVEFFQRTTNLPKGNNQYNHFGTDYLYFQVGYDLDGTGVRKVYNYNDLGIYQGAVDSPSYSTTLNMAYYSGDNALLPIGTNEVPFIGNFDGGKTSTGGITIANLSIHCSEKVTINNAEVIRSASDIGVFGYIADSANSTQTIIQNAYFDGLTIDLSDISDTSKNSATSVSHVDAHTSDSGYVGYIAGHVHTYTNKTASADAKPLRNVYVNNATIQGGPGTTCGYGYIGKVDTNDGTAAGLVADEVAGLHGEGGGGSGSEWGGSINIKDLNLRLYNMMNTTTQDGIATDDPATHHPAAVNATGTTYNDTENVVGRTYLTKLTFGSSSDANKSLYTSGHRYYKDSYNIASIAISGTSNASNSYINESPLTKSILYSFEDSGTKTLSFDRTYSPNPGNYNYKTSVPGTILPLNVDKKAAGYATMSDNTGYIVGGYKNNASTNSIYYTRTTVRTASSSIANIVNSINSSTSFNSNRLEIISNTTPAFSSSNYGRIEDNYNKSNTDVSATMSSKFSSRTISASTFEKYSASRAALDDVLSGASFIHGLHFTGQPISTSYKETLNTAYINENVLSNYELPKHSIDFNLKENGYINFFAGSYQNAQIGADSFFSLYTVTRSGSSITNNGIKEISKVYKNIDSSTKDESPHLYLLTDNTYTTGRTTLTSAAAGDLEFDMQFLWADPPVDGAVYYFEIPVNKGEYAMGCPSSGATQGSYLMYLDIGASGATGSTDDVLKVKDTALFTQIGISSGTYFTNSCFNVAYVVPEGSTKDTFSISVSLRTGVAYQSGSYTCYDLTIVNTSGTSFVLNALLMDDDNDPNNDYFHMFSIIYNGGEQSLYTCSDTFTGVSGETSMTQAHPIAA